MATRENALKTRALPRLPVLALLHPRAQTRAVLVLLALGLLAALLATRLAGVPTWVASAGVLALLLVPGVQKWRGDRERYGSTVMVLSILLAAQGFHSIEHAAQWIQYHVLHWPPFVSNGLISAANSEWIHFVWNWAVVAAVLLLVRGGMRSIWAWLLLLWATAHALEHAYMFVRYLGLAQELQQLGFPQLSAQGLPGVLGRDGWLARSAAIQGTFLCRLPGLTTAPRIDVHFWWNSGEIILLLLAAHRFLLARLPL
ncbi:MAG TPA: hypothetical protein VFZ66_08975, partial [Herpetosiphonaceae bacterium]